MPRPDTTRLNLSYPAAMRGRIDELQRATGAPSTTDTIADAIKVYEWFVKQRERGREILVRDPGGTPTVVEFI